MKCFSKHSRHLLGSQSWTSGQQQWGRRSFLRPSKAGRVRVEQKKGYGTVDWGSPKHKERELEWIQQPMREESPWGQ